MNRPKNLRVSHLIIAALSVVVTLLASSFGDDDSILGSFTKSIEFVSDFGTIVASGLAVFIFLTKRRDIGAAFRLILSYSSHITMSELKFKLESLNNLDGNKTSDRSEIKAIMGDIAGQMRGNKILQKNNPELISELEGYINGTKNLTEPNKRSIASQLREILNQQRIDEYGDLIGDG